MPKLMRNTRLTHFGTHKEQLGLFSNSKCEGVDLWESTDSFFPGG